MGLGAGWVGLAPESLLVRAVAATARLAWMSQARSSLTAAAFQAADLAK